MVGKSRHEMAGLRFGSLTVIRYVPNSRGKWECYCDCGNTKTLGGQSIREGKTISCGCFREKRAKAGRGLRHGMCYTGVHVSWESMMKRCYSKKNGAFKYYGARGIMVCERWHVFENFFEDMGERPEGMTIDRIDVNGDYTKENCRWATHAAQANNKSNNQRYLYKGVLYTASELRQFSDVNYDTLRNRLRKGWDVERALTTVASHANRRYAERT